MTAVDNPVFMPIPNRGRLRRLRIRRFAPHLPMRHPRTQTIRTGNHVALKPTDRLSRLTMVTVRILVPIPRHRRRPTVPETDTEGVIFNLADASRVGRRRQKKINKRSDSADKRNDYFFQHPCSELPLLTVHLILGCCSITHVTFNLAMTSSASFPVGISPLLASI